MLIVCQTLQQQERTKVRIVSHGWTLNVLSSVSVPLPMISIARSPPMDFKVNKALNRAAKGVVLEFRVESKASKLTCIVNDE